MCGRFTLTADDIASLARAWGAEVEEAAAARWRPRFNVAPGDPHPVLVGGGRRRLISATFGVGVRAGGPGALLINARIESASSRPTFREAWQGRRAAVLADGFYEWTGPRSARRPTWFHLPDRRPMLLAALLGEAPGGGPGFVVLTREADPAVRPLHDRMPLILAPALLASWLDGPPPPLPTASAGLVGRPVSPRVNSVENDDAGCLEEAVPDPQGSLF